MVAVQPLQSLVTRADRQGVDISVTVCVCVFFVRLRISPPRIKLAASNLQCGLSASKAGNLPFWGTLLSQKPKIPQIGPREKDDKCFSW